MKPICKKIPLSEIVWDPSTYPRSKWNTSTIARYAEAMQAGSVFPPMILEYETNRLLDGKHRYEAHKTNGSTEVDVEFHEVPAGVPVKLYAGSLSSRHGDRLSNADAKEIAREIATDNPEYNGVTIAEMLGFLPNTVQVWTDDIRAKHKESRDSAILRLVLLGWTQQQIAEAVGIGRTAVTMIVKKVMDHEIDNVLAMRKAGHPASEVANRTGLTELTVRRLEYDANKTDDAGRLKDLGINVQPYDVWNFAGCHDLMGDRHPGRIPGELICHALYFLTKQGDVVVDPMAGSGTTVDACLAMGRDCFAFDLSAYEHKRQEIVMHDLALNGWPDVTKKADLIFWDPPYFDKKDSGYAEGSVSALPTEDYLEFFRSSITSLYETAKKGCKFAFLMSDWNDEKTGDGIFLWDYSAIISEAGWKITRQIQVPLGTQQVHPDIVNKFRESRRMARLGRYLLVAEKR